MAQKNVFIWRKGQKPLQIVVICDNISYAETYKKEIEAILDITKYNKKGNITHRVPVTIVNGKILVTSIKFSNATVVE